MSPSPTYLTTREFERWADQHDERISRILNAIERQGERNLSVESRVSHLESNQMAAGKLSAKISGAIGAIVAALVAGIFSLLSVR
jgi:hypothetical protein